MLQLVGLAGAKDVYIEVKGTCFNPTDHAFKDIYGSGFMYGGELGVELWFGLDVWFEGKYFNKSGETSLTREKTEITLLPLSGGLMADIDLGFFSVYLTSGLTYLLYKESSPIGEVSGHTWGWLVRTGAYFDISNAVFLDVQIAYSDAKLQSPDLKTDLGGLAFGAGLGFRF